MKKNILILAGEPSGDIRAGELLKELRVIMPEAEFWGIGGDTMKAEGVDLIEHIKNLSVVGIFEIIKHLPKIIAQYRTVVENIEKKKPDLAILVDYPGFNLKIAKHLKKQGIPVVYYIIPQVWAWGAERVELLRRFTDKLLVLFDFEKTFLAGHGVDSEFVGHPLVDKAPEAASGRNPDDARAVALLPGSRTSEIHKHLETMMDAASKIKSSRPKTSFILAESGNIDPGLYDAALERCPGINVERIKDNTFSVLDKADIGIVASGTATLESAVMGTPMVIVYKANPLSFFIGRNFFMTVPFFGLVNNIAGEEIAPELIQKDFTADKVSSEVIGIMDDPSRMARMKSELGDVKNALGGKGASRRAAEAVKRFAESL